jgi:hypothetical protein
VDFAINLLPAAAGHHEAGVLFLGWRGPALTHLRQRLRNSFWPVIGKKEGRPFSGPELGRKRTAGDDGAVRAKH